MNNFSTPDFVTVPGRQQRQCQRDKIWNKAVPSEVIFYEDETITLAGPVLRAELISEGDSVTARVKQSTDQNDPVPTCDSVALCSDEQLSVGSVPDNEEATSSSLIENWIDA
ncbi:MAG: hypothetical protein JO170_06335 [Verrucomicrobia bacterium]|nr:hypothetical protein [Verrucomicrobiota bacterium]